MRKNPLLMEPLEPYQLRDQQPIGDQLAEAAARALYGRSVPTAAGNTGRIQGGVQSMLARMADSMMAGRPIRLYVHRSALIDIFMGQAIGRGINQPFDEALDSFNKQAKKFRKRF